MNVLTAERLAAMELLLGGTNREPELERAWKNLLVGQHHDIQICGLVADAKKYLSASLAASTNVVNSSLQFLALQMKGDGLAQTTVFNPLSWPRREWIEADVTVPGRAVKSLAVRHEGRTVPSVLLKAIRSSSGGIQSARVAFLAELPPLAFTSYSIDAAREPAPAAAGKVEIDSEHLRITTPFVEARLNSKGGIASLADKRTGVSLLIRPGRRSAFFAGRINGKDSESQGKWTLHATGGAAAPWAMAREYGFIGDIPYTLEICFRADTPRLDCRVSFHFEDEKIGRVTDDTRDAWSPFIHEDKLRFKLFPATGPDATGVRDLPFAVSETTNRYVDGIYWTALAGRQGGVAFFNRGTMGAVRESDGGFSLPLAYSMYYIWGTRMLNGDYAYEFAVHPFTGEWRQADLHRQAIAYNFPAVSATGKPGGGALGETVQPLELGSENVILSALYPENGGVFARLYECAGRHGETSIAYRGGTARVLPSDLLGRVGEPLSNPPAFHP